ncbi:MAG: hypothetical protein JWM14_2220 [Chitinophagaceae bacterium]|nr:hypothetical protein [Chitinophagaceae bacterium]
MKKTSIVFLLLFISVYAFAQTPTLQYFKACKDIPQSDYIQLRDKDIVYPVVGLTEIHMEIITAGGGAGGAGGGGLFAVIEIWVVDAEGKIVYNNIHTINPRMISETQVVTDADYLKYMKKNERELRKRRRSI